MPEIILPCPNCDTKLLVDEQNAGMDVLCPGCQERMSLPRTLDGLSQPVLHIEAKPVPELKPAADAAGHERRNHPLYRSGHMAALPEEDAGAAPAVEHRAGHLPERRGQSPEEEMRRMAALTADPVAFNLQKVDTKGRSAFPCPACHRPVWIQGVEWGRVLTCDGCSEQIVAPDPSTGEPARVVAPAGAAPREKTVLPARRQVENLAMGEQTAAGRPKRQGGQLPPARSETPPAPQQAGRKQAKAPAPEPIPARGDVDISAPVHRGPSLRHAAAPEQTPSAAPASAGTLPADKTSQKGVRNRQPNFTPKHEADLSAETTGDWGGGAAQEQSPGFRRTLTFAIITLVLGTVSVAAYLFIDRFKEKPPQEIQAEKPDSPTQNVDRARLSLERFFAARTVEEMAKEVRHPERTAPRMQSWYARTGGIPKLQIEDYGDWREQDNFMGTGVNFLLTSIKLDAMPRPIPVAFEIFPDGRLPKLDWEYLVSWSSTPWSEFIKNTSERTGEFRVTATPLDYYNYHYSDRQRYLCFRVCDRENFAYCYAYCDSNSEVARKLLIATREARAAGRLYTENGGAPEGLAEVILRLRFYPEGKQHNQAVIDSVVWTDWLYPVEP